mgnify:CR=1 FL=1
MATQNPLEQEGTYPLPEAQLDRFLMLVLVDYPQAEDELQILQLARQETDQKLLQATQELFAPTSRSSLCSSTGSTLNLYCTRIRALSGGINTSYP